ncbi:MAG: FAD-dependent oxidoreductase [Mycolicibacterium sp.]|nr:FAD-dependent oxidoreductase [Mycobacterium sp.]MCB9416264.1 FAD-dependent oxidoreductase [Mycolicibacterium sp.]
MTDSTTCAIVGGGPAGMVLGLLLARAGVEVTVLEKHADFLRDFRGDTVHPSTLRLLDDLGLWQKFTALPQSKVEQAALDLDGTSLTMVDFRRLRQPHPYIAMVPQWDLLDLLADAAQAEPTFSLRLEHEVTGLLTEGGRTVGVRYRTPAGEGELRADLTVACDGRTSVVRQAAGLTAREYPVPFDVWWFRLPRADDAEYSLIPRTAPGRLLIMIPREGYFQIAYLIPKGSDAQLRAKGLDAFKSELAALISEADVSALNSMDDVKFLDVRLNRLERWNTDGLLCIGDAAHAMSPVGGIGINIAVQDAVGAATLLAEPLLRRDVTQRDLAAVRRRRLPAAVLTQAAQRFMHRQLVEPVLRGESADPPAVLATVMRWLPWLAAVPAYFVGVGVRPERAPAFARR